MADEVGSVELLEAGEQVGWGAQGQAGLRLRAERHVSCQVAG